MDSESELIPRRHPHCGLCNMLPLAPGAFLELSLMHSQMAVSPHTPAILLAIGFDHCVKDHSFWSTTTKPYSNLKTKPECKTLAAGLEFLSALTKHHDGPSRTWSASSGLTAAIMVRSTQGHRHTVAVTHGRALALVRCQKMQT